MDEVVALNDQGTMLYCKKNTTYEELVGVTEIPDLGGAGSTIEVTELKSKTKQYIDDRQDVDALDFTYNRTSKKYEAVKAICDGKVHEFLIAMSDGTGTYVKGTAQTWKNGFGAGSAQQATLHIVPTEITDKTSDEVKELLPTV